MAGISYQGDPCIRNCRGRLVRSKRRSVGRPQRGSAHLKIAPGTDSRALAVWGDTRAGTRASSKQDLGRAVVAFSIRRRSRERSSGSCSSAASRSSWPAWGCWS